MDLYKKILELDSVYEGEGQQPGGFTTNNPNEAIKEIVRRMFPGVTGSFPITENINLNLGPNVNEITAGGEFDVGGGQLSIGGGMRGDDKAFGIGFRKEFSVGGMPYRIFGKEIDIPLIEGVMSGQQNKKSVEEGFKKLEKWLKNPTPERWLQLFGRNNAFGLQLRNYLLGRNDLGSVKGMPTANKVFDAINVKKLLTPKQIEKINLLTTGGKGVSLKSIAAKTFGNLKFSMEEVIETIKNFQNGEAWLRRNPDPDKIGPDGKNIYRKYANAIKSMQSEQKKIGGFPFGDNSEKKLWSNLYRASYRGDRIKIVGEFADGNLPINKDGKIDWKMQDKNGVAAWKRVQFIDTQAPKNTIFKWGDNFKRGDFARQIDNTFGEGFFKKSTEAYDTQVKTGSKRLSSGETIKSDLKIELLKNEALLINPKATKKEINDYINKKAKRFNITEVHHPDGVGVNPYKTEPVFRYANRTLETEVMQPLKAGNIDINEAKFRIDKINENIGPIRTKLDDGYYGNFKNTQKSIVQSAENFKSNSKQIAANLRKLGFKCRFAGNSGGLGKCDDPLSYVHDIKKQEELLKTQTANKSAQALKTAKKLNTAKTLFTSTLGPGALAFEAVAALPIAYMGYVGGKTPANILADSTFNLLGKSDQKVLLDKAIELGYDTSNIKNVQKFYKAQKAFEKISEQADEFRGPDDEFQFPQIYEKKQKDIIDATKKFLDPDTFEPIQEKVAAFEQLPLVEQEVAADQAKLAAERAEKAKLSLPNFDFSYGEFSNGGIAGLSGGDKSGPPPERGPDSEGLRSLMKRCINL